MFHFKFIYGYIGAPDNELYIALMCALGKSSNPFSHASFDNDTSFVSN